MQYAAALISYLGFLNGNMNYDIVYSFMIVHAHVLIVLDLIWLFQVLKCVLWS